MFREEKLFWTHSDVIGGTQEGILPFFVLCCVVVVADDCLDAQPDGYRIFFFKFSS